MDDHFYSVDAAVPGGYGPAEAQGYLMLNPVKPGLVPLFQFYKPYHAESSGGQGLGKIIEGGIVGGLIFGPAGFLLGAAASNPIDKAVSVIGKYTVEGGGTMVGLVAAGAALVLAGPGVADRLRRGHRGGQFGHPATPAERV